MGRACDQQKHMYETARSTLDRMTEIAQLSTTLGEIFDVHADGLDKGGFAAHRFGATGYSVGCTWAPTSMYVPPMIYSGNPTPCEPGMTLFYHVMIGDSDTGYAMEANMVFFVHIMIPDTRTGLAAGVGQTFALRENGPPEVFSALPLGLFSGA